MPTGYQMKTTDWSDQIPNYSALEDNKRGELALPQLTADHVGNRSSGIDVTIPISTEPIAAQRRRSWLRRYWIFVLAMAFLIVGGIIAGAVGGISAAHKSEERAAG
ncbi:hypothetical protein EsH8_II_000446 [Colletotrichum jinshuiense]